jgi:hypothetical protein
MAGAAATAMIFVCLMVATLIVGLFFFIYAAYCFLVVVQDTAAGADSVRWPSDPLYDKLPRAAYLAGLLAVWIAPAGLLLRLKPENAIDRSPVLTFLLVATAILWLLFPIGLFSSLSASSPLIVFRFTILRFFARRFGAALCFYAVSALLFVVGSAPLFLAFARGSWLLTFVGPFVTAAAFLIYARLLGRMAYLFDQAPSPRRPRLMPSTAASDPWSTPDQASQEKSPRKTGQAKKKRVKAEDPWAVPEEQRRKKKSDAGAAARIEGYAIAEDDSAGSSQESAKAPKPVRKVKSYGLSDEPLPPQPKELPLDGYVPVGYEPLPPPKVTVGETSSMKADVSATTEFERRLVERREETPPPERPLMSGVYTFPWYPETLPAWILLSLGGVAVFGLLQATLAWKPWD